MFNIRKTAVILGIALIAIQGFFLFNYKAQAEYHSVVQELMSRPYPRIGGNQWHILPDGSFSSGNTAILSFIGKYLDFVSLNRSGGTISDLFLDFYQSTHDSSRGLLKTRNDIYNAASANSRRVYVLAYQNMADVWNYESINSYPNENYWMKPDGENIGTWDYMDRHNYWDRSDSGDIIPYPGYSTSQRRMFDSRIPAVQDYWAQHAKGVTDQGFDGIFSDNWMRSGFAGNVADIQKGWNDIGAKFKQMAPDKILLGNSPPYSIFTSRDICMLEDRVDDVTGTADKSISSYLNYSDQAASMNQVCFDTFWDEDMGPVETFRVPINLLTDNILGLSLQTKQGHSLSAEQQPVIEKLGKIGYPKGPRYRASGVLQRDFDKAKVILNDTSHSVTISLPAGVYKNLDGALVNSVTLASCRGIVLKNSDIIPPAAPADIAVTGILKGASTGTYYVNLVWKDNSNNESGFKLYQSINSIDNFKVVATLKANSVSCGLNLGRSPTKGTYYYKIISIGLNGIESQSSSTVVAVIK